MEQLRNPHGAGPGQKGPGPLAPPASSASPELGGTASCVLDQRLIRGAQHRAQRLDVLGRVVWHPAQSVPE
eukprot:15368819-Alexandrium_andersonii.AAC.1